MTGLLGLPFSGSNGLAENAFADVASEEFIITDYDVSMNVSEDKICHITETITCDFSQYQHGIYRSIPTSMQITRTDGSSQQVAAKVRNFEADTEWTEDDSYESSGGADSCYNVRLGDSDKTIIGKKTYTLNYDYQISGDNLKDTDEFYFNIIGTGWNTDIQNVTFNIRMPKQFDAEKTGFSMGTAGNVGTEDGEMEYSIEDRTINGKTLRTLGPHEALTVRAELPEGYFDADEAGMELLPLYLIPVILTLISLFLCIRYGKDEQIVPVIRFSPPEGYNSLDVGVMHHLDVQNDDVLSLLIYLADKGYIAIEPVPDRHGKTENARKFIFHKLKEYDEDNLCEKEFMQGLFEHADAVSTEDLENEFYLTVHSVAATESGFTKKLVSRKGRLPITIMSMTAYVCMCLPALNGEPGLFVALAIFGLVSLRLVHAALPQSTSDKAKKIKGAKAAIAFIAGLNTLVPLLFMYDLACFTNPLIKISFLAGDVCLLVMSICWAMVQSRTPLGVKLAGEAAGFAEFIETAEKDRIEMMIDRDPQSFYKIIPYAMALGVSDKWIRKFRGITVQKPHWYHCNSPYFDGYMIGRVLSSNLNSTMRSASGTSSSGGGGSSGGGAGGGGGGSW